MSAVEAQVRAQETVALRKYIEQLRSDVTHALNVQSRKLRRQLLMQAMARPVPVSPLEES